MWTSYIHCSLPWYHSKSAPGPFCGYMAHPKDSLFWNQAKIAFSHIIIGKNLCPHPLWESPTSNGPAQCCMLSLSLVHAQINWKQALAVGHMVQDLSIPKKSFKFLPQHLTIISSDLCGHSSLPCMHPYNQIALGLLYGLCNVILLFVILIWECVIVFLHIQ